MPLSLRHYTRTHPGPASWRRQRGPARARKCALRTEHHRVHQSLDGRVFEVRRLRCNGCGRRYRDVTQRQTALAVEAGF